MADRILALGGHDFDRRDGNDSICDLIVELAEKPRPRICLLPTASGDPQDQISRFRRAFGERDCAPSVLSLFRLGENPVNLRDELLAQDVIYAGGGSLVNLIAIWRAHRLDEILRECWREGILLCGQSAGAMCWFEAGITKSSGKPLAAAGLGLLGGSLCVHYNNEPERRAAYLAAVADGMPEGYGLDDYAGLLWEGEGTPAALTARRGARAYRVSAEAGEAVESPLPARFLAAPAPAALREDIAEFRRIKTMRRRAGWLG
jgi:dipeptidase E